MINRGIFFAGYKKKFGNLKQSQDDGLNFLLDKLDSSKCFNSADEYAYILATIKHETAESYKPVKEYGSLNYLKSKKYYPYIGYGYVQLTWKSNYVKMGELLGIDLVNHPEKALEPETAWLICEHGFYYGDFTGKKMSDYINSKGTDYFNARRIINGIDKASLIQSYAKGFEQIIEFK